MLTLLDQFTTDDAGPLVGARTCEPGPGSITLVNTTVDGVIAIDGSKLTFTKPTDGFGYANFGFTINAIEREIGRCWSMKYASIGFPDRHTFGITTAAGLGNAGLYGFNIANAAELNIRDNSVDIVVPLASNLINGTEYEMVLVLRGTGCLYFIKGGTQWPDWELLWVSQQSDTITLYPMWGNLNTSATIDDVMVRDLSGVLANEYGGCVFAEFYHNSGDVFAGVADALGIEIWTPVADETYRMIFRRSDSNNYLGVECSQGDSTIQFFKVEAGVETSIGSAAAQTFTAGAQYRIVVRLKGDALTAFVDRVEKLDDTSSFNQTETGFSSEWSGGTDGGAVANFQCWPLAWTGDSVEELEPSVATRSLAVKEEFGILFTDSHRTDDDETGLAPLLEAPATSLAREFNSINATIGFHCGDLAENFATAADHVAFKEMWDLWACSNKALLFGNHDAEAANDAGGTGVETFTTARTVWSEELYPYNPTITWSGPELVFIGVHTTHIPTPDVQAGNAKIGATALSLLQSRLEALTAGQKAIICSHFTFYAAYGDYVHADYNGDAARALFELHAEKILCCVSGHRHSAPASNTLNGVTYINLPCHAYNASEGTDGNVDAWVALIHDPVAETITLQVRDASNYFGQMARSWWVPLTFELAPVSIPATSNWWIKDFRRWRRR